MAVLQMIIDPSSYSFSSATGIVFVNRYSNNHAFELCFYVPRSELYTTLPFPCDILHFHKPNLSMWCLPTLFSLQLFQQAFPQCLNSLLQYSSSQAHC